MKDGTHCGRRTAWLGGLAAALSAAVMPLAQSKNIIDEWSRVQAPPPPALKAVGIDPGSTALIVMDISTKTCSSAHRPRCVATLPAVARLVREARASGALVPYSLIGHDKRSDIPKPFRGFEVIVPIDGMSSGSLYGEQSTAWYLAHAPRVSQHTTLTAVDRMKF